MGWEWHALQSDYRERSPGIPSHYNSARTAHANHYMQQVSSGRHSLILRSETSACDAERRRSGELCVAKKLLNYSILALLNDDIDEEWGRRTRMDDDEERRQ